jgi:hypothetical protein
VEGNHQVVKDTDRTRLRKKFRGFFFGINKHKIRPNQKNQRKLKSKKILQANSETLSGKKIWFLTPE